MSRAEIDRLYDIIQAIDGAERAVGGLTYEVFAEGDTLFAALCHFVMVISEASRHISEERKAAYPHIEWRQLADTGNFIRHVYFKIGSDRLWDMYRNDMPRLRTAIEQMIEEFPADQR